HHSRIPDPNGPVEHDHGATPGARGSRPGRPGQVQGPSGPDAGLHAVRGAGPAVRGGSPPSAPRATATRSIGAPVSAPSLAGQARPGLMARPVPAAIEPSPEPPAIPSERRTPRDWSHRAAVLVMVAVAVIAFARPLAGRGAFLGADINLPLPPWNADTAPGFRPYNWIVGDTLDAYIGKR